MRLLASIALFCLLSGCVHPLPELNPAKHASPTSDIPYEQKPADTIQAAKREEPFIPDELKSFRERFQLSQLVDIALRLNPDTKVAWSNARAAAADWAVTRGIYYPTLQEQLGGVSGKIPSSMGGQSYFQSSLSLNYLLLDFGGRTAKAEAKRQALVAANWNHNQVIQDVLRNVPQGYYTLLANKALVKADEKSLAEAKTSLEAAEARKQAGAATLADVLQARANEEQAVYNLSGSMGAVDISRGNLATSIGWPANMRFDIADEFEELPIKSMGDDVDALIEKAQKDRPDLNAAMASVRQKEAELKQARALPFPNLQGSGYQQWFAMRAGNQSSYYGGLQLTLPLFNGFALRNQARLAKANLDATMAKLESQREAVIKDVWSSHFNFTTATKQLDSAKALLSSALESFNVSFARYKAGAANIVELMTTQSQLAGARSQLIGARMNVYTSYAELVHSIGAELSMPSPGEDHVAEKMD